MLKESICIIGNGSWATALAKIVLYHTEDLVWNIRKVGVIKSFVKYNINPNYLTNIHFDVSKIHFTNNVNYAIEHSDIIIIAIPSPFVTQTLDKITVPLKDKLIVSAIKGMISETNETLSQYMCKHFNVPYSNLSVIAGPCHAEEVALERFSFLTVGSKDLNTADIICKYLSTPFIQTTTSTDILGLEYSSVLKNIYAIAMGICHSLQYGDNFQAVLISNAIKEIETILSILSPQERHISDTGYIGDILVTSYSNFSRNRQFGQMVGMGYSIKAIQNEMQMVAEGYYGTYCMFHILTELNIDMPIVKAMYDILYNHLSPILVIKDLVYKLK